MEHPKEVVIESRKRNKIFLLVPFILFLLQACKNIYQSIAINAFSIQLVFSILLSLAFAGLMAYLTVYTFKRLLDKNPGLILNESGIMDHSGLVSSGFTSWSQVLEISSHKVLLSDLIIIKIKHPKGVIRNQNSRFKQFWLGLENRYWGSPVNISVGGLQIKFKPLFSIIQQHFLASQIETRTYELKKEKEVIQREKMELVNSINYAKRIQTALLPSNATIQKLLGENFIFFLPKDIVSGDFFWVETVNEWTFFAVCDCTGHGVPGALISIVCNNALTRTVREHGIIEPSKILDHVAELFAESLGLEGEVKDGMDASVCAFNNNTRELFWAGANIPLWIAREDTIYELLEFKPDKQPIGLVENRFPFTNNQIEIRKGDILYLCSDGFADQFGGANGKKLTRKKFKELLMKQRGRPLSSQHDVLLKFHLNYKGNLDQVDDILVAAIRIEK